MKVLEVKPLVLPDVKTIKYHQFADERGFFTETFRESDMAEVLPNFKIKQVNESFSKKGVLRGLHLQWNPYMDKLVRTVNGHMIDLFLDIRKGSKTYGKIAAVDMPSASKDNASTWLWVPVGFAHGFVSVEETTIEYFCTSEYSPGNEAGISPLSPDLDWSLCDPQLKATIDGIIRNGLIISDKDKQGVTLSEWSKDPRSENFL
jgi:dTDP-4-dehydrorhamnose 3,5-epimerase